MPSGGGIHSISSRWKSTLEALIGLGDGIFGIELASRRVDRQLAGDVKQIANLDGL